MESNIPSATISTTLFEELGSTEEGNDDGATKADVVDKTKLPSGIRTIKQTGCLHWSGP